jgi:hypothetical protein
MTGSTFPEAGSFREGMTTKYAVNTIGNQSRLNDKSGATFSINHQRRWHRVGYLSSVVALDGV